MHEYQAIDRASAEPSKLLLRETPLETLLSAIGQLAVAAIPACDESGVTLEGGRRGAGPHHHRETASLVDDVQYDIKEGPCIDAGRTKRTVLIEVMKSEARWPRFTDFAASQGVQVPLFDPDHRARCGGRGPQLVLDRPPLWPLG